MLAVLSSNIAPKATMLQKCHLCTGKYRGIDVELLETRGVPVMHVSLNLPLDIGQGRFAEKAETALEMMEKQGVKTLIGPSWALQLAHSRRIFPVSGRAAMRMKAAQAARDYLKSCGKGEESMVVVYSKMPSREVSDCLEEIAPHARYIRAEGGKWAQAEQKRLYREYGIAPHGAPGDGVFRLGLAFDGGFAPESRYPVIDLTGGELRCSTALRLKLRESSAGILPDIACCDSTALISGLVQYGALGKREITAYCDGFTALTEYRHHTIM